MRGGEVSLVGTGLCKVEMLRYEMDGRQCGVGGRGRLWRGRFGVFLGDVAILSKGRGLRVSARKGREGEDRRKRPWDLRRVVQGVRKSVEGRVGITLLETRVRTVRSHVQEMFSRIRDPINPKLDFAAK